MRVLLTSFAMDAHFNGSVPLAWALRSAGHEVRVASQPALTGSITAAGLTAVPVGTDPRLDDMVKGVGGSVLSHHANQSLDPEDPGRLTPAFLRGWDAMMTATFFALVNDDPTVDDLVAFARAWKPDLVLWEPFTFAGAVAAMATGAAHARVLSFPDLFSSMRRAFLAQLGPAAADPAGGPPGAHPEDCLGQWLQWTLGRHGVAFDEQAVTGQWSVDQVPRSFRPPSDGPTVGMRYIPYNGPGPAVVPDWLRTPPERPRVCVTLGLTARTSEFPNAVPVDLVLKAIDGLDIEVVATLDAEERTLLTHVPDNVRLVDHVPLHALLPTCAAVVHHGGAGTWSTALVEGVPQIAMGWIWDAIERARRQQELGAGLHLPSHEVTVEGLRSRLVRLLEEPSFTAAAARLRAEAESERSPAEVVPVLERLTAQHHAHGRRRPAGGGSTPCAS
ncbi:activator-dependent family glycosyltransferase [Streptomyces violaceorubidus]|uniref:activator-dependent family glycosyltransferase n=1 Tax=Streptomyces violaceorubidus TaxID=284042 RepID=UPI0004C0082A|nr:activator-dependent family glycosyltransferase [Streptomyces violaceorubidus]